MVNIFQEYGIEKNLIRGHKNYRSKSRIFAKLDFNIAWNRIPFN